MPALALSARWGLPVGADFLTRARPLLHLSLLARPRLSTPPRSLARPLSLTRGPRLLASPPQLSARTTRAHDPRRTQLAVGARRRGPVRRPWSLARAVVPVAVKCPRWSPTRHQESLPAIVAYLCCLPPCCATPRRTPSLHAINLRLKTTHSFIFFKSYFVSCELLL